MRPGPPGHSHSYMKQPLELVQQSQQMKSHESMMNQAWNTQAYSMNQQAFHSGGNKSGGNTNSGNNIGSQRKGNHQMGNQMGNMGGMKYMSNTGGGFPGQVSKHQSDSI